MSPADRQDGPDDPRPYFQQAEVAEVTGLFDPGPQEVKPWALFQRPEVDASPQLAFADPEAEEPPDATDHGLADAESVPVEEGEAAVDPAHDAIPADGLDELLGTADDLTELLDGTLADEEPVPAPEPEPAPLPCPHCEATEAAAAATLDATIEALQLPYFEGAEALSRAAQEVTKDFAQNLLRLSVALAGAVLRRAATLEPDVALRNLESALEIAGPLTELSIRCHPDDADVLRAKGAERAEAITGRLVDVHVRPVEGVERGACIVDFGDGLVDARWQVQLDRLADALSPTLIHHASETAAAIVAETMTPPDVLYDALETQLRSGHSEPEEVLEPEPALTDEPEEVLEPEPALTDEPEEVLEPELTDEPEGAPE